ncbi:DNA cytosine methyltransferase [Pelotomaculum terephthalicicum JT]|jgi:DNA (cytosine-5)-methyltransferase 1|uniref:DNA cytosine methyltransferase n=1 Tax=Pelotomaculum terephthalicicum TaxID=206393 RepID=UPI001F035CC8|nr:DNA cytosine methyltransferase [Pelotomaculum terephthalicicum]MCG9966940.1 DNA cytosine methyltransferase [Pelotomaculum terephthalicicum JT]
MMRMGSLFDGIGGFPLAAVRNGFTPVWASEIEAFPIEVTKIRFPEMRHVGDITKLDGAKLPPVDVICGGSPCQDLSVAGQRRGLAGERSGLFMEQTRIAKEMRKADEQRNVPAHLVRPRYLVWENVPGAFSSADGEDFRAVIEEIVRIKYSACDVPRPESGRWESAGAALLGDEFSLAWRVMDAQFWGVAQRRRRIFLVADFGGTTAPEILFKQDGLFGNIAQSGGQRQGTAAPAQGRTDDTGGACLTPWDVQSRRIFEETGTWPALYGGEGGGHGYIQTEEKTAIAFAANQRDEVRDLHDVAGAIQAQPGMKQQTFVAQPLFCLNDQGGERMDVTEDVSSTLRAGMGGHPPLVSQPNCMNSWDTQQSRVFTPEGVAPTLAGADGGGGRNPAGLLFAAGVVSKGDGDCFLTPETHTSLTGGGGQAGQGYPCVLTAGFCGNASAEARGIGYQAEYSPTIKTGTAPSVLCLNDQGGSQMHSTEDITGTLRAQEHGHQPLVMATQQGGAEIGEGICPTITASAGMSGNNQPVLFENHGIDSRYTGPHAVAPTMSARMGTGGNNVPLVGNPVAFSLDSKESNSMKSANPHSGCRETDVARTIDTTNPDPSKNQGGIAILQETICIAGNTIDREPENGGNGLGCKPDISYTITTSDRHAVCEPYQEVVGALCRGDEKGIGSQYVSQNKCIVERRNLIRRLTPLECERLQGFPDGWTLIPGASDSARYKALGNSVAIPCVSFVLRGIAYFLRKIDEEQEESPPCTSTPTT